MIDYIKNIFSDKKAVLLMVIGLAATVISFAYPAASAYNDGALMLVIYAADLTLLFVNARKISSIWTREKENAKKLDTVNAFFITVIYFCAFLILAYTVFEAEITFEKIMETLAFAVNLGPSLALVLPILFLLLCLFGG
jgi:hypothetical protein